MFLLDSAWPYESLPPHCSGAGVLLSPDAARRILARSAEVTLQYLIDFWQDDILYFGVFAIQMEVKLIDNELFSTARPDTSSCFDTCHKMV